MLQSNKIFEAALAIQTPWFINDIQFSADSKKLYIYIDFKPGSTFPSTKTDCPDEYKVKDTFNTDFHSRLNRHNFPPIFR